MGFAFVVAGFLAGALAGGLMPIGFGGESAVDRGGGIEEVQDDVCVPDRGESVSAHAFVEDVVRCEESRCVMQNHLHGPSCNDAYNASTR